MEADTLKQILHVIPFSLWDTIVMCAQLLTLFIQTTRYGSHHGRYVQRERLVAEMGTFGRETLTMEDPYSVIVDSWMKGLRDFDVNTAYEAMYKSATTLPGKDNFPRPITTIIGIGLCATSRKIRQLGFSRIGYYIADNAWRSLRSAAKEDAARFHTQSLNYKQYYCPEYGLLRPKLPDGTFVSPFDLSR